MTCPTSRPDVAFFLILSMITFLREKKVRSFSCGRQRGPYVLLSCWTAGCPGRPTVHSSQSCPTVWTVRGITYTGGSPAGGRGGRESGSGPEQVGGRRAEVRGQPRGGPERPKGGAPGEPKGGREEPREGAQGEPKERSRGTEGRELKRGKWSRGLRWEPAQTGCSQASCLSGQLPCPSRELSCPSQCLSPQPAAEEPIPLDR